MKNSLLATVAAVALIAGAGFASAEGQPKGGQSEMNRGAGGGAESKGGAEMKAEPKADSKTTGQASEKSAPAGKSAADEKSAPSKSANDQKAAPAGKSAADEKSAPSKSANDQKAAPTAKSANDDKASPAKSASDSKNGADSKTNAAADGKAGGANATLTTEQKTKIRTTVIQSSNAPKVSRSSINFNINVGTVVPRSVKFVTVSPTIVEYYPAYRGYSYFIVDEEIIIVEPSTLKIIAVINV